MEVNFYDKIDDSLLKYAVIIAKYQQQYIWVRHKARITWEIPGGKREQKESILACAKRELYEESGALTFTLHPLSIYGVKQRGKEESYGMLYLADISELSSLPDSEIAEIQLCSETPSSLTYPNIQPILLDYAKKHA